MKIIFIHGNGGCTADMNWYASADQRLRENGFSVIRETLPDNVIAHENFRKASIGLLIRRQATALLC